MKLPNTGKLGPNMVWMLGTLVIALTTTYAATLLSLLPEGKELLTLSLSSRMISRFHPTIIKMMWLVPCVTLLLLCATVTFILLCNLSVMTNLY